MCRLIFYLLFFSVQSNSKVAPFLLHPRYCIMLFQDLLSYYWFFTIFWAECDIFVLFKWIQYFLEFLILSTMHCYRNYHKQHVKKYVYFIFKKVSLKCWYLFPHKKKIAVKQFIKITYDSYFQTELIMPNKYQTKLPE